MIILTLPGIRVTRIGHENRQPFRIREHETPNVYHNALHIIDNRGAVAFTVWAYELADDVDIGHREEELWERTFNLLRYFNLRNENPYSVLA